MLKSLKINNERKVILIGGAVLLFLGMIYRFYPDIHGFFSISDEIAMKRNHIEKYISVASQKDRIDKDRLYLNKILNRLESRLIVGGTPALAAVKLQEILNEITQATHVKINTMQVLKVAASGEKKYVKIPIKFSFNSNIRQLKNVLYKIEASSKLLIVTDVKIDLLRRKKQGQIRSSVTVEGVMKHKGSTG